MSSKSAEWEEVGVIGVDAGLCWVGDPCYILHRRVDELPDSIGKNWDEFCAKLTGSYPTIKQFNYDMGHAGLGVVVSTGYGDGRYPVYVKKNKEGRVVEVKVVFDDESDEA